VSLIRPLRDLSIRQKMTRVAMLASSLALVFAAAAFIVYDIVAFRTAVVRRLSTVAEILASNSASPLLFQDGESAATTLSALRAEEHVRAAAIYDAHGRLFARYAPPGSAAPPPALLADPRGHEFRGRTVVVSRPVLFKGASAGTVVLQGDLEELAARLVRYASLVALVSVISFLLSLALSSRMQSAISGPILRLAQAARRVSHDRDFAVRAAPEGRDEVGELIDTFNDMLSRLQARDAEVQEARSSLERRVEERTHDLQHELQERRRTEQELTRSRTLLAEAQRLAHIGSWEWDPGPGALGVSDEAYAVFGMDRSAVAAGYAPFIEAVHPADRQAIRDSLGGLAGKGGEWDAEFRVLAASDVRWIHGYAKALPAEPGRPHRLIGTVQDVTARKAAEDERAQLILEQAARAEAESARHRAAFLAEVGAALAQSSLDEAATLANVARLAVPEVADWCLVLIMDADGNTTPVAAAHADPTRLEELWDLARRPQSRPHPGNSGGVFDVVRTGEARLFPTLPPFSQVSDPEHMRLLDRVGYTSSMLVPLRARNSTFGCLALTGVGRRLTESDLSLAQSLADRGALAADNARLYREAQEANRMKDEFLATLSHELRTPLNAIVGWTKLLQGNQLDEPTRTRAVDTIDRNARAQTQLIEDILDVSRIVAGKLHLNVRAVDLASVVEGALDSVRHAAEAKGVRLVTDVARAIGPLEGDGDRLQQVTWNLLSNAIKFTPRGGTVRVRLRSEGDHAELSVQDDGMGIRPEFLPHVFERFRQADSSSTRPHGGLGLGLAIVRHLVELHGGSVDVASEGEGKGATFTVRLPFREETASPGPSRRPERAEQAPPRLHGVEVLVVEDEEDARELIRTILEQLGAGVLTAASGAEALAALDQSHPNVMLSDIEMPGMDGYRLMRAVRERPADRGGRIPAVALTAYARPEERAAALEAGFQRHVSKPVEPSELAAVVSSLAGRAQEG
jgi:signal transduction histidine kinase/ActR/RegA family two-component response regulator